MKNKKHIDSLVSLGMGAGVLGMLMGGMYKMFGLGNKIEKKDVAKEVLDLVFESYENKIKELEDENSKLFEEKVGLENELEGLKAEKLTMVRPKKVGARRGRPKKVGAKRGRPKKARAKRGRPILDKSLGLY